MTCPHCNKIHSDWLSCDQAVVLGEAREPIIGFASGALVGETLIPVQFDRKAHMAKIRAMRKVAQK